MRMRFAQEVLGSLLRDGIIQRSDSMLAVCAAAEDSELFRKMGFSDVVLSNLDENSQPGQIEPYAFSRQDAQNLTYDDASFDLAVVIDGLHHCASPHRALLEMYRVARKCIVVMESRDSLLTRLALRLGLVAEYEVEEVASRGGSSGGFNNTDVPNYVYRWTEDEFRKTVCSFNPVGRHSFRFFHGVSFPFERAKLSRASYKRVVAAVTVPVVTLLGKLSRASCNLLAMVAVKPRVAEDLWPWLKLDDGKVVFDRDYGERHYHM